MNNLFTQQKSLIPSRHQKGVTNTFQKNLFKTKFLSVTSSSVFKGFIKSRFSRLKRTSSFSLTKDKQHKQS
jgi:hypothetical protein